MTDEPVNLDGHRGMAAQKATNLRRLLADVVASEQALRATQDELEARLIAAPAPICSLCLPPPRAAKTPAGRH